LRRWRGARVSAALPRQRFLRDHNELWISRPMLVTLYGRDMRSSRATQLRLVI